MLSDKLLMQQDSSSGDIPEGVSFDGATDYLSRSSDLVGNVDSKTFTFSCWVYKSDQGYRILSIDPNSNSDVYINVSNGTFSVYLTNSASTAVLNAQADLSIIENTFIHILFSVDLSDTAKRHLFVNDSAFPTNYVTYINDVIDFTKQNIGIGARAFDGENRFQGRLSNLFLDYTYRDLSIEANRRLFITADGKPAKGLEALNPIIYLPMKNKETAHINLGTGGDFVQHGTLETADRGANQDNCVASSFDGVDDYLTGSIFNASFHGVLCSFIVDLGVGTGATAISMYDGTYKVPMVRVEYGQTFVQMKIANASQYVYIRIFEELKGINQITFSLFSNNTAAAVLWVNGIRKYGQAIGAYASQLDNTNLSIGLLGTMDYFNSSIGEVYLDNNSTTNGGPPKIDISTNNPFWDSTANKPIPVRKVMANLGSNPLVCMPLDASNPGKNYGRCGDFTLHGGGLVGARGASEYIARSAKFDGGGSLDLQAYNGGASGNTASFVFAVKCHATSSSICGFQSTNNGVTYPRCRFYGDGGDYLRLVVEDSTGINLNITINNVQTPLDTWHLIQISFDMTDSTKTRVYVDGVVGSYTLNKHSGRPINWSAFVTAFIGRDYTAYTSQHQTISAIYFTTDYIDFSQEANRNLFINQLGYPRDLRPEIEAGNIPTPLIYLPFDDPTNLGKNLGTAGDFAVNGTVTPGQDFSI